MLLIVRGSLRGKPSKITPKKQWVLDGTMVHCPDCESVYAIERKDKYNRRVIRYFASILSLDGYCADVPWWETKCPLCKRVSFFEESKIDDGKNVRGEFTVLGNFSDAMEERY